MNGAVTAQHADPCLLHVISVMTEGRSEPLLPSLPGTADNWVSVLRIGVHQEMMRSKAALRTWLRNQLKAVCASAWDMAFELLLGAELQDVKAADWKGKVHRRCGTSAEKQANFDAFLEQFVRVLPRLPFQTNASSLEALLQLGDMSPGRLVPFFGALGKSFRVVSVPN